ncbi:hypothetical protein RFI_09830 [Reticulomyxa filosa]|uniref:Uncharacterized protein n=1 Tax=Reticulomyxa filosa TaxID=46433 RepID=X6NMZ4_RETFI|nr:hypothetical protein RFI_09830 [Reticulomyxa filosa]|eukprot:ETO27303.1 hypothetical protein RFI_09830 [Reticulomyxa filosa]
MDGKSERSEENEKAGAEEQEVKKIEQNWIDEYHEKQKELNTLSRIDLKEFEKSTRSVSYTSLMEAKLWRDSNEELMIPLVYWSKAPHHHITAMCVEKSKRSGPILITGSAHGELILWREWTDENKEEASDYSQSTTATTTTTTATTTTTIKTTMNSREIIVNKQPKKKGAKSLPRMQMATPANRPPIALSKNGFPLQCLFPPTLHRLFPYWANSSTKSKAHF